MATRLGFPPTKSAVDLSAQPYQENKKRWEKILGEYSSALAETCSEGKTGALERHISRGQLLGMSSIDAAL